MTKRKEIKEIEIILITIHERMQRIKNVAIRLDYWPIPENHFNKIRRLLNGIMDCCNDYEGRQLGKKQERDYLLFMESTREQNEKENNKN